MTPPLTVLFPIGGTGERFRQAGVARYKPLIRLGGKTLIELALGSYPKDARFIAIVRPEFRDALAEALEPVGCLILNLPRDTRGPLETISLFFDNAAVFGDGEILIADSDALIERFELAQALAYFRKRHADGGVTTRRANNPHYSYCRVEGERVLETREKDPFTPWSSTGPYWWKSGGEFAADAAKALKHGALSISPVFNETVGRGGFVAHFSVKTFEHLGSPAELREYADRNNLEIST